MCFHSLSLERSSKHYGKYWKYWKNPSAISIYGGNAFQNWCKCRRHSDECWSSTQWFPVHFIKSLVDDQSVWSPYYLLHEEFCWPLYGIQRLGLECRDECGKGDVCIIIIFLHHTLVWLQPFYNLDILIFLKKNLTITSSCMLCFPCFLPFQWCFLLFYFNGKKHFTINIRQNCICLVCILSLDWSQK